MITIRDLLNRARWRDRDLHALEISLRHRGAPDDRRVVSGARVVEVRAGGIELTPDAGEGETQFIPYHRFLSIRGADGALVWDEAAKAVVRHTVAARATPAAAEMGTEVLPSFSVVLRAATEDTPIVIDGSAGEGGGQILRSSLALSMITGTPFVIERIRAGRKKGGLMRQHLTCVKAAALVSDAETEGAVLGSTRLVFRPRAVRGGDHELDVGSAGSVCLVLQTLALPLALAAQPSRVVVRGGTHARWAPIHPFLAEAWLPLVRSAGAEITLELRAAGFYPAGGGEIVMTTSPSTALAPMHLASPAGEPETHAHAIVAGLPESIARRELVAAAERLGGLRLTTSSATVHSPGPGNAIWLSVRDAGSGITNVFSEIGEVDVRAEEVGRAAADRLLAWRVSGTSVEAHLADQVMLPIALAGEGSFTTDALTLHARTNAEVIAAFTGKRLRAWDLGGSRFRVSLAQPASA
jgi:RNA 3'-terminal phosphate cyclase (ATP)